MTATLDVAASPSDSRTLASDDYNWWILREGLAKQSTPLDTRTDGSSTTCPVAGASVLLGECCVLEAMCVDDK